MYWILLHPRDAAKSLQSCLTLCDPIDSNPPGSPISEIVQSRTLEWGAISFSNAWNWKVRVKPLSHVWLLATPWTAAYQAPPSVGFSRQEYWSGLPLGVNISLSCSPIAQFVKNLPAIQETLVWFLGWEDPLKKGQVTHSSLGFPCGSAGKKKSACNAGDLSSIPGLGRSSGEGKVYPLQYSGLENSMDL